MKNEVLFTVLFLFSVFISSVSQILLKKSAGKTHESRIREYLNPPVITAYFIFFVSTLLTMYAYRYVPLSLGPVLESTGYLWVSLLGLLFLKEKISRKKWIGLGMIIAGIIIFNL